MATLRIYGLNEHLLSLDLRDLLVIRAIDSTFYEITTLDETVLDLIKSSFNGVRLADVPFA